MFCNQCEQTAHGTACDVSGVCGKNEEVAALQDGLIHALQGLAYWARQAHRLGLRDEKIDVLMLKGVFTTLTNVDFDPARLTALIREVTSCRESLGARVLQQGGAVPADRPCMRFAPSPDDAILAAQGRELNLIESLDVDPDIRSLKQILLSEILTPGNQESVIYCPRCPSIGASRVLMIYF